MEQGADATRADPDPEDATAGQPVGAVLASLLNRFPRAMVSAITESGVAIPVPPGVLLGEHRPLDSTFDAVTPADRVVIVDLYARARTSAFASAPVHLLEDPSHAITIYMVDARPLHGVLLAIFGDALDDGTGLSEQWAFPHLPPRLARAHKDGSAIYISIDAALTEILGWTDDQLVGRRALEIIHPDDRETAIANWIDMLATPGPGRRVRLRHEHADGRWVWLEITNHNRLDDQDHEDVMADMVDISEEMAAHEALQAREQLLHELAQTIPLGLFHSDPSGVVLFANSRLSDILGVERLVTTVDLVNALHPADRDAVNTALLAMSAGEGGANLEIRIDSPGDVRYGALRLRPVAHAAGNLSGIIGCIEDVTESVHMRRQLEIQATFDALTQCCNRRSVMAAMSTLIEEIDPLRTSGLAVVYVDLDRFKPVNDVYGHSIGDQLLMVVGERLRQAVRSGDVVGRIGGDEFIVVCPHVDSPDEALGVSKAIAARLCGRARVGEIELDIRASVGVAWTDDAELDSDQLVAAADAAMYSSKREGLCRTVLADPLDRRVTVGSPSWSSSRRQR